MENKEHYPLIRTIYLYLFALVGLTLLIFGTVRFIDMGLKAFIFTKADQSIRMKYEEPLSPPMPIEKIEKISKGSKLSQSDQLLIRDWLAGYKEWQSKEGKIDYLSSQRQRQASTNASLILVGLPLYLYHWSVIRRETKRRQEKEIKKT